MDKELIKCNSFLSILAILESSAMGLVSEGDDGVIDLRTARMWLFFQVEER